MRTIRLYLILINLLFGFSLHAEPMYFTFVDPDSSVLLQKADVSLKIDKKETALTEFFFVDVSKRSPEVLRHPAGRRHYVVIYDLIFSRPEDLVQARRATEEFLKKMGGEDLVALAGIDRKMTVRLFTNFTTDRSQLIAGLNSIGKDRSGGLLLGPDGNLYPSQFPKDTAEVQLIPEAQFLENVKAFTNVESKTKTDSRANFIDGIVSLASFLSKVEGRKNLILFSPGFKTEGIKSRKSEPMVTPGLMTGPQELERDEEVSQDSSSSFQFDIEIVPDFVSSSDSSVHIFNLRDEKNDFFRDLSHGTNGLYFEKSANLTSSLDQILNADKSFYVLAWEGTPEKESQELHSLKIEAANRKIISSKKWFAPKPYSQYRPIEKQMHIAKAIYADYGKPFSHIVFWCDYLYEEGISKIPAFVQIPGGDILQDSSLDLYGFSISSKGGLLDFYSTSVQLDKTNKNLTERLTKTGVKFWNVLLARQDQTQVRWIIVQPHTGMTITHSEVLKLNGSGLSVTRPFFPALNFDWIVWPKAVISQNRRGVEIKYPYRIGEDYFFPDLTPQVRKSEKGRIFYFKIYNLPSSNDKPPISLELRGKSGDTFPISDFGLRQKPETIAQGGLELFWRILSFPQAPQGSYRIQVHLGNTIEKSDLVGEINLELLE